MALGSANASSNTPPAAPAPPAAPMPLPSVAHAVPIAVGDPTAITIKHWSRIHGGDLFATSSRVEWAVLLQRTFGFAALRCLHGVLAGHSFWRSSIVPGPSRSRIGRRGACPTPAPTPAAPLAKAKVQKPRLATHGPVFALLPEPPPLPRGPRTARATGGVP